MSHQDGCGMREGEESLADILLREVTGTAMNYKELNPDQPLQLTENKGSTKNRGRGGGIHLW